MAARSPRPKPNGTITSRVSTAERIVIEPTITRMNVPTSSAAYLFICTGITPLFLRRGAESTVVMPRGGGNVGVGQVERGALGGRAGRSRPGFGRPDPVVDPVRHRGRRSGGSGRHLRDPGRLCGRWLGGWAPGAHFRVLPRGPGGARHRPGRRGDFDPGRKPRPDSPGAAAGGVGDRDRWLRRDTMT